MTLYKSVPVVVEAKRFDGSGANAQDILGWLSIFGVKNAVYYDEFDRGRPIELDLKLRDVKIAKPGDYVVRLPEKLKHHFQVLTEEQFKASYAHFCGACSGRIKDTTNITCQICGHDYSKGF